MNGLILRLLHRVRATFPIASPGSAMPTATEGSAASGAALTAWHSSSQGAKKQVGLLVTKANRLRDAGDHNAAAQAYGSAILLCPWRTDLKVQRSNMLKDLGRLADAERLYRDALEDDPDDADIYLQLGHVLKLMGRRSAAIASYERALRLHPGSEQAHLELVQLGSVKHQREAVDAQIRGHGIERMLEISAQLTEMRNEIDRIGRSLPDLAAWTAIPAGEYGLFRRLFDVPRPFAALPVTDDPIFRIIVWPDTAPIGRLHSLLASLLAQQASAWDAVFIGSSAASRDAVLRLATTDARLRWQEMQPDRSEAREEAEAAADAPDWLLLLAPGAVLHPQAMAWFCDTVVNTKAVVLFSDEEETAPDPAGVDQPQALTARWSFDPEILFQANVFGDTLAVRLTHHRTWNAEVPDSLAARRSALLLAATGGDKGCLHIPLPLVARCRDRSDAERDRLVAHAAAVQRMIARDGLPCRITYPTKADPDRLRIIWQPDDNSMAITVMITTRNNACDCIAMVESLFARAQQPDRLRCVVIDNGTDRPEDLELLAQLAVHARVTLQRVEEPFNWSHLNNVAVQHADSAPGSLLVFANDDMKMLTDGWDEMLSGLLARPDIGALGVKLVYPDHTIQHAGILFGWRGSVIHDGLYEPAESRAQSMRWHLARRVSAVTGAFLAIRRTEFSRVGGFDAAGLPIGYSDVDLSLKLRRNGLNILWTPDITLLHFESKSRGLDHLDQERHARSRAERRLMEARWGEEMLMTDPSMNPIWLDATLPFRLLRPYSNNPTGRRTSRR